PATANGLHASTYASRSGSKVLIISGDAAAGAGSANGIGPDYKSFNATGVLAAAGIRTFVATSPETARGVLADAVNAAMQGAAAAVAGRWALPGRGRRGWPPAGGGEAAPAAGAAATGDRGGGSIAAPEPQADHPGRPRRAPRRRQGRDRAAGRPHRRADRHL